MKEEILTILDEHAKLIEDLKECIPEIQAVANKIIKAYKARKKVVLFGNGGSAADAQHVAAEFVGKFYKERDALPALAFHCNTSSVTATANDFGYDLIFERQVVAFVEEGDVVIGISTSGNSPNVLKGIKKAKELGAITVGMTGRIHRCMPFSIAQVAPPVPVSATRPRRSARSSPKPGDPRWPMRRRR